RRAVDAGEADRPAADITDPYVLDDPVGRAHLQDVVEVGQHGVVLGPEVARAPDDEHGRDARLGEAENVQPVRPGKVFEHFKFLEGSPKARPNHPPRTGQSSSQTGARSSRTYTGRPLALGKVVAGSMPTALYRVASTCETV